MATNKKNPVKVPKEWEHWRMSPSDKEAIDKLLEVTWNLPFWHKDLVELAELWPRPQVKDLFREHGLDPEIDWRAVVASFHKSFADGDRGRPKGTSRQIPIRIEKLVRHR